MRAVSILGVLAFHSGLPGIENGGFFSQDIFFVLSGMLITLILLRGREQGSARQLTRFYLGRARRLLPALLVMVLVVELFVQLIAPPGQYPGFRGDVLSVFGYYGNWHFIAANANYFQSTGSPSLFTHMWSLAVEEQFYFVWPLLLLLTIYVAAVFKRRGLWLVLILSALGALASGGWMALLYRRGASPTRLYYGTDTHIQVILVGCFLGALLAMVKTRRGSHGLVPVAESPRLKNALVLCGLGALVGLFWQWTHAGSSDPLTFQGGFLITALMAAVLIASVACVPTSRMARTLAAPPLRFIGTISYGMYLWYFPIFQYVDGAHTGLRSWSLFAVRTLLVVAVAWFSYVVIERPIRSGTIHFSYKSPDRRRPTVWIVALAVAVGAVMAATVTSPSSSVSSVAAAPTVTGAPNVVAAAASSLDSTKLLIVGDSTALTLGVDLPGTGPTWNASIDEQGLEGCGVAIGPLVREDGSVTAPPAPCNSGSPRDVQWPARLSSLVRTVHPKTVVLLAGRWEVADRFFDGRWTSILDPSLRTYILHQIELAVRVGTAEGAHMALLTSPCFSSGEQPDGSPWPNDSPRRLGVYNQLLDRVARQFSATTSVVNLGAMVCPGGEFRSVIDGVTVRAPDGIHFPFYQFGNPDASAPDTRAQVDQFARWIGPRLMPKLLAGSEHQ